MSDNDDIQVGKILSRREVLGFFGLAGAELLVGCGAQAASNGDSAASGSSASAGGSSSAANVSTTLPSCIVTPELTEGPYFVDEMLNRSDIRSDPSNGAVSQGTLLTLTFNVSNVSNAGCWVLPNAMVDLWHCDALGVYSDVRDGGFNTVGQKFLRGYQATDANGQAKFTTIIPGWYQGRTVHLHFKVRSGNEEFTSQLFFDDALIDQVHAQAPYAQKGQRTLRNTGDNIYRQGGDVLLLNLTPSADGYAASFDVGFQAS